jgi:hypothetical protein
VHAFGERAVLKLMYAVIQRASHTWQRVATIDFERKQLIMLREPLYREFDAKDHLAMTALAHDLPMNLKQWWDLTPMILAFP